MSSARKLYLDFYIVVLALYVYFNKGIAYTFLAEALLVIGVLVVLANFRSLEIPKDRKVAGLFLFFFIALAYIIRALPQYQLLNIIRDSFIFNYGLLVIVIFFFKADIDYLLNGIYKIYTWFPLVATLSFFSLSYIPFIADFKLVGGIHLLHYKYGDMAVHLFITVLFILNGKIKLSLRYFIANAIMIAYLFLIASSYSRAGMLCFTICFCLFFFFTKQAELKKQIYYYLRFVPLLLILALPIYMATNVKENFQGRKLGLDQLKENITSIVSTQKGTTRSDNNVWRLVWWGKIIDYTFLGEYFLQGKGLGMSLAADDNISPDGDDDLRSPHNFHLNILARFGVPIFLLWCYWMYLHFKQFRDPKISELGLVLLCIITIFLLNASFDVFLEGSMGAFPFWTFVGLYYLNELNETETAI